ncbi:hypothetical protein RYX36_004905 [Vicia faba]
MSFISSPVISIILPVFQHPRSDFSSSRSTLNRAPPHYRTAAGNRHRDYSRRLPSRILPSRLFPPSSAMNRKAPTALLSRCHCPVAALRVRRPPAFRRR